MLRESQVFRDIIYSLNEKEKALCILDNNVKSRITNDKMPGSKGY